MDISMRRLFMKISTPIALLIIFLALLICSVVGYFQYEKALAIDSGPAVEAERSQLFPPYHTEEGWMVQQVGQFIADLAALANGKSTGPVQVEIESSQGGASRYSLREGSIHESVSLEKGVWNPETYRRWVDLLLSGAKPTSEVGVGSDLAKKLLEPDLETFLAESKSISDLLQAHPNSSLGHIDAALLLGTIGLNDYAGCFRDIRPVLNRMVAHLAVADALGANQEWTSRQLAEAIRLTLCGQQANALSVIDRWTGAEWQTPAFQGWAALLRLRNTDDWREKSELAKAGPEALRYEYFRALTEVADVDMARTFLDDLKIEPTISYFRMANESSLSVANGHYFTSPWIKAELAQAAAGALALGGTPGDDKMNWLRQYLDVPDGSPVQMSGEGKPVIQVAGLNLFAGFHQRHLMDACYKNFRFLNDRWGVPQYAEQLQAFITKEMSPLRYSPFLQRLMARKPAEREERNKACIEVLNAQTQLMGPALWEALNVNEDGEKLSLTVPDFHPWFRPEVPQGTAFEVDDRLYQIGVGDENDAAWIKELRKRAPYSYPLARHQVSLENNGSLANVPPDLIVRLTSPMVEYEYRPMKMLADAYKENPEQYEQWMVKLATMDSSAYIRLAEYFQEKKMDEKAAEYFLTAFEKTKDRVYFANVSQWIVQYLYAKGDKALATKIATEAAEVYSARGLSTYAWLMEQEGRWDDALKTCRDIDERYNEGDPCEELACLIRQRMSSPQIAESDRYREVLAKVFPQGLQKVDMSAFSSAPQRGVLINGNSASLRAMGLRNRNIIVAFNGYRTDTAAQYLVIRELDRDPHLRLIVWNGKEYREHEGNVPKKRLGVDVLDYRAD